MKVSDLILAENSDWVALNKPAGLLSIPDREGKDISLKKILAAHYPAIYTVHRLDKETSGLILFAKTETAHKYLSRLFEERNAVKIYRGLVLGAPLQAAGEIDAPLAEHPALNGKMIVQRKGKPSLTGYRLLDNFGPYAWMEFYLHTGRTHQIRVHLQHIGHPIAVDPLYGDGKPLLLSSLKPGYKLSKREEEEKPLLNRLALHAYSLEFTDSSGEKVFLEAPLPKDLRAVLQQLEKRRKKPASQRPNKEY